MKYALSILESQFAMVPQPAELHWDELISLFDSFKEGDFDKTKQTHFNGVKFREGGRRNNDSIESIHILVLDYDDGMSIEEAKKHFRNYQHIGYTSYNHQYDKQGDGHKVDKFRILLPLSEPCPMEDWLEIRNSLATFAPDVDQVSARPHQPFAVPIKRPNAPSEIWINEGKAVNWTTWDRTPQLTLGGADPYLKSPFTLHADDVIKTKKGTIRVGEVTETINQVYCPFHNDKSPGAYLAKSPNGNIFLHCRSKCGTTFVDQEDEEKVDVIKKFVKRLSKRKSYKERMVEKFRLEKDQKDDPLSNCHTPSKLLEFVNEYQPFSMSKRAEMLRKRYRQNEKLLLLYAAEGFGKSYLAKILIEENNQKVLFACKSNAQAEEQANSFREKNGLNVQLICARDHWLKTLEKIPVEYYEASHPWDSERINERKTQSVMRQMGMTTERIAELWDSYAPPEPDFHNHDLIITTQARVMGWGRRQFTHRIPVLNQKGQMTGSTIPNDSRLVPSDVVIFCDDGQMEDFCLLADFNNDFVKTKVATIETAKTAKGEEFEADPIVNGRALKRKTVGDFEYFVRPKEFLFGHGFIDNQIIFSTTEHVTRELIFKRFGGRKERVTVDGKRVTVGEVYEPKLIPEHDQKMDAGKITVMKTEFVRKKRDGILPVIAERVRAVWNNKIEYVADGQGCKTNHVTVKGQNSFADHDLIIEISYSHMGKIRKLLHELEWNDDANSEFLKVILACDTIHQAIGRNSGYRFADRREEARRESVVLIEPRLFKNVLKYMRYKVTNAIDVDYNATRFRRNQIGNDFPTTVGWYIKNVIQYLQIQGGRTFIGDVKRAFNQVGANPTHPFVRQTRLLDSLNAIKSDIAKSGEVEFIERLIAQVEDINIDNKTLGSPSPVAADHRNSR